MDCFWWKLAFGLIAFGLAFCIMTIVAFYNDVINNNKIIDVLIEENCRLNGIIENLTNNNNGIVICFIPSSQKVVFSID